LPLAVGLAGGDPAGAGIGQNVMTREERTVENARSSLPRTPWAYAHAIVPPQAEDQLNAIRTLLEKEHSEAQRAARMWTGRLVCEQQVTHILVVSDSPDQSRQVNRRLEGRLKQGKAGFSLTVPMALADDAAPSPGAERPS
jgi:hypothetical protein